MSNSKREILVTSALPYANGSIHIGHLVEYIQTDIWVRFQKMRGHQCHYVCADDAHGTPIMLKARSEEITPEALIEKTKKEHQADFAQFNIGFDQFHSTHSEENKILASQIYLANKAAGHISQKTIKQAYDAKEEMFLPDRFIKGTCPKCGAEEQYGDNCEKCGATYDSNDLINPISAISGEPPIEKESVHYFFELAHFESMLKEWTTKEGHLQKETANKVGEWFESGLNQWDISRDAPYFGFEIPDAPNKYFYVWLDAPIGYMASFKALCDKTNLDFNHYWNAQSSTELYHFIGKDIIYFHALFWPAVLEGAGFRKPTAIFSHGFLTVDGKKMSKSRGTFIKASTWAEHIRPEYLRYYFATKLTPSIDDIDLNLTDFQQKINSDLVGKVVNIASRCAGFIKKRFNNTLAGEMTHPELFQTFIKAQVSLAEYYEQRQYRRATQEIMTLADMANQYIDEAKPWVIAKDPNQNQALHDICSMGIQLFRVLIAYLQPILPEISKQSYAFLNIAPLQWEDIKTPLLNHQINVFKPLATRVEEKQIERVIADSKQDLVAKNTKQSSQNKTIEPIATSINIEDFAKIDLRVAKIVKAEEVEKADKLLKLTLDIGQNQTRQVFAGIKSAYKPEEIEGKLTVMVANLEPRKMRFGLSEGMLLAAGSGGSDLFILQPDQGAIAGMRVK